MNRFRVVTLSAMSVLIAVWLFVTVERAAAQRRDDVPMSTQNYVDRAVNANTTSIAEIKSEMRRISDLASDARDEVRSLRNAIWGLGAALLLSFLTQVVQIRKGKAEA